MLSLEETLKGLAYAQNKLRNATAIVNPVIMSEQMMRMSQYAGSLDEHLAELEREYETKISAKILEYINDGMKTSPAETKAKTEMSTIKGQILYISRLSSSAWKQIGTIQSRINHLKTEAGTNI
jgi:hypothetical protein